MFKRVFFDTYALHTLKHPATDLYFQGRFAEVLALQQATPTSPELTYLVARVHLVEGRFAQVETTLDALEPVAQDWSERLTLLRAFNAHLSGQTAESEKLTQSLTQPSRFAQVNLAILKAERLRATAPQEAIHAYREGVATLNILRSDGHPVDGDLAYAYLRMSGSALQNNLYQVAANNVEPGERYASLSQNPILHGWAKRYLGRVALHQGRFEDARQHFQEAETLLPQTPTPLLDDLRIHQALVAILMDQGVRAALEKAQKVTFAQARQHLRLLEGYQALFTGDFATAEAIATSLTTDYAPLQHRLLNLRVAALAVQDGLTPDLLAELLAAIPEMARMHQKADLSAAHLIYGWGCIMLGRYAEGQQALIACMGQVQGIGHMGHLWRLILLSAGDLMGWWETLPPKLHPAPYLNGYRGDTPSPGVILFGFDRARIFVGLREIFPADIQTRRGRQLIFYMLHKKRATLAEIRDAFWPREPLKKASKGLGPTRSQVKKAIKQYFMEYNRVDEAYHLRKDFPLYYDAHDFEQTLRTLRAPLALEDRFALYQKAIRLYQGPFLREFDGGVFDEARNHYEARCMDMMFEALELAEAHQRQDLRNEWRSRMLNLFGPDILEDY